MDLLTNAEIAAAGLADWRKLGQALHGRYAVTDLAAGGRLLAAVADAAEEVGAVGPAAPRVTAHGGHVDLRLVSPDAVHRDAAGVEHVVEWVTQRDVDLARRITELAGEQGAVPEPGSVTTIELALDTARSALLAPVWAALLTGSPQGAGAGGGDVWDATGQVPLLWFQDTEPHEPPRQRFHVDVWVAPEVAEERIAAAVAAGGIVVDDSQAPAYTVVADVDGNKACVCTSSPARDAW
ncbi:4a-hydroxytetrahydrobiopterin dehydratase [Nocardioides sp. zg-579]|uniref:4a-hydroxytetrahydrobiopterin dehydratase n=1 Tax=Nocardioides marmotae TaxID=2663857 RepID=A0A6I3JC91_9ACTN|nr:VOC family protein [Nocardioides marmotae]MCR6032085.1 4a-hydroxytetrahydrobiopterin dehydratase [Gordonia jinghuaiqii]MTB95730.1 4a-hydroxytetrahydrobiopterin dehydratase [Nocardioides marmotae]QKE01130.1 4a-hydroxytetrahydrobiopterin dehydratase [Nocardioides marmotae]